MRLPEHLEVEYRELARKKRLALLSESDVKRMVEVREKINAWDREHPPVGLPACTAALIQLGEELDALAERVDALPDAEKL